MRPALPRAALAALLAGPALAQTGTGSLGRIGLAFLHPITIALSSVAFLARIA